MSILQRIVYLLQRVVGLLQHVVGDPLENILYSVSVITHHLAMILYANSEMAGDDRGPIEVL